MKLRLWYTSDWEVILRIHDDGREEVLYEHHAADSSTWEHVIETLFNVKVEDVNMSHGSIPRWNRYKDIPEPIRKKFNENPGASWEPWTAPVARHSHSHRLQREVVGFPKTLTHEHDFVDDPRDPHDHADMGYGILFVEKK